MISMLRSLSFIVFTIFFLNSCKKNEAAIPVATGTALAATWQLSSVYLSPVIPNPLVPTRKEGTDLLAELKQIYNTDYPNTYTIQFNADKEFITNVNIPSTFQCTASTRNGCDLISMLGLPTYKPDSSSWSLNDNKLIMAIAGWTGGTQGSGELFSDNYSYLVSVDKTFLHLQRKGDFFWIGQRLANRTLTITLKKL